MPRPNIIMLSMHTLGYILFITDPLLLGYYLFIKVRVEHPSLKAHTMNYDLKACTTVINLTPY